MSELLDMNAAGREFFGRSAKTAKRIVSDLGVETFLIRGRLYVRRSDVEAAIESRRILAPSQPQPASLKTMLDKISADVLARRRPGS
jgi:hypothetical protein